jgi:hypothetical protein
MVRWIEIYMSITYFLVVMNGKSRGFSPSFRSLQQGDPLSFFFCHRGFMRDTKRGFTKPGVSIPLKVSTNYHYSFMFYS